MARYKLMSKSPGSSNEEREVGGQRKNTKADVEAWIEDNINAGGLDWRSGYMIKFRNSDQVYLWRWIKDNKELRP